MAENGEFLSEQQRAMERMREMSRRSNMQPHPHKAPQAPSFIKMQGSEAAPEAPKSPPPAHDLSASAAPTRANAPSQSGFLSGLKLPILSELGRDKDITLILGLALLLMSEKSDRLLLLALIYILM